jgi:phosphoribosylaminoimidazolecarboxamide formyltransferase/IMP cyclohydrolase
MSKLMRKKYSTALEEDYPQEITIKIGNMIYVYSKKISLRYGENPHQPAAFYSPVDSDLNIGDLKIIKTGKGGLSMTNLEDINNSLRIVGYFNKPGCAVMKHVNPSGVAVKNKPDQEFVSVYKRARDCDSLAAFGSVVGFNSQVDVDTAKEIISTYVEAVVAPGYEQGCMDHFNKKKNLRVIQIKGLENASRFFGDKLSPLEIKVQMDGSLILQTPLLTKIRGVEDLKFVTDREATKQEIKDLIFSWYVCINVRSNGVVLSKNNSTIGIGTGQQDRVTSVHLAINKAKIRGHEEELRGAVLASDGFFPFRDNIDLLGENGISACIQPGGSIRDKEIIQACNEYDIAMAVTNERCFRHF